jgi:peptide/nickel transport system permease protein
MSRLIVSSFAQHRLAEVGAGVIVLMVLFCFVGPHLYHTNQVSTNLALVNLAPSRSHLLGTTDVGYDELGRLMIGGQSALEIGLSAALLASVLGTAWGAVAGYVGGPVDAAMMRVLDVFLAVPALLFLLLLASMVVPSVWTLILVVGAVSWLTTARLVRGEVLAIREREYIAAAASLGSRMRRIVLRHIVPNVLGTVVVQTTFEVANAILLLAGLSYLGLGPPPPATNWGSMLSEGLNYAYDGYWWLIYPAGLAIVVTVVAFNLVGDALRDALEVRLQRR